MSPDREPSNIAASVRARLLNVSRQRGAEFQLVLSEFAIERLLHRLGASSHSDKFVLKGAMLIRMWTPVRSRATWDLDLLGRGPSSIDSVVAMIRDLCAVQTTDGIVFDPSSIKGEEIRQADRYAGVRVRLEAWLGEARIPVQVDVGFGDAVVPAPRRRNYPTLLDHAAPRILVYPREAVVAEKCEAMISLGVTNSRMKDFYDVHLLAMTFAFDGPALARAIRATFLRRKTPFPEARPLALSRTFLEAPERQTEWRAFLRRGRLETPPEAGRVSDAIRAFLDPALAAAAGVTKFGKHWPPGGPWGQLRRP